MFKFLKRWTQSPKEACISIYNNSKKKMPNKTEEQYLKIVLLTKPPFDYQLDPVITYILSEFSSIEKLSDFVEDNHKDEDLWSNRKRNLAIYKNKLTERNNSFFKEFWN